MPGKPKGESMPPKVCEAMHTMLKREKVPSICAVHSCMQPVSQQPRMPASALHAAVCDGSTVGRGCFCGSCWLSLLLLAPPAAPWLLPGLVQAVLATLLPPVAVAAVLRTLALDAGGECLTWPAGGQAGELGKAEAAQRAARRRYRRRAGGRRQQPRRARRAGLLPPAWSNLQVFRCYSNDNAKCRARHDALHMGSLGMASSVYPPSISRASSSFDAVPPRQVQVGARPSLASWCPR